MIRWVVDTMIIYKLGRHFKMAVLGIFRNFWMSFSAITAVTVTLILVALFTVLSLNVRSFMNSIEESITIRALVDNAFDQSQVYNPETHDDPLGDRIRAIPGVKEVTFVHRDEEFERYIAATGDNAAIYERFRDDNPMSHVYRVSLEDGNSDFDGVSRAISELEGIRSVNYGTGGIHTLIDIFGRVSGILIFFMGALILLAVFLIANTIKLTIFARKNEISIMRLVGASNGYIRFPFVLEGILIGILGSIVPLVATIWAYRRLLEEFSGGFFVSQALQFETMANINMVALSLLGIGAFVGMIGSLISVGRYLKV